MIKFIVAVVLVVSLKEIHSLIVPDEIPSLLSLVYSNIPPIKKGTDSRLGWGFRLGEHADFQVLLEIGPQTNTRPLANEGDKANKRGAENNLRNALYAQYLLRKQQQKQPEQLSETDGGKWIGSWSQMMKDTRHQEPVEGAGEVDASLLIPPELTDLYGQPTQKPKIAQPTTAKVTTNSKDALDNVDIE